MTCAPKKTFCRIVYSEYKWNEKYFEMIQHLAIVTTESLPLSNSPCGGGGVRIWGVGESLRRQNVKCTYFLHEKRRGQIEATQDVSSKVSSKVSIIFYKPELLHKEIGQAGCDAALFEQWQPMTFLQERLDIPILVDLPGPLAMEYYWLDRENFYQHIIDKLNALSQVDYFFCAHERQRGYFTAWLTWAGVSPECIGRLAVVPFTLHEMPYSRQGHVEDESQFFWGGLFWPWHERLASFECIAETLNQLRTGQLVVAGVLPEQQMDSEFSRYIEHPHVSWLGQLGFSEFIPELKRGSVAVDLCKPTQERLLSSDLRTGTALWAGVPSLVTPESPWAKMIKEHNAGWVLPYDDLKGLKELIIEIALSRVDIVGKRRGAREVSKLINDDANTKPIMDWLKNPSKREAVKPFHEARAADREARLQALQIEVDLLKHEKSELQRDLDGIRSNPLFKLYKRLKSLFG